MGIFLLSFFAGVLTILAPCTLSLLPILLTGSTSSSKRTEKPLVIGIALVCSIFLFTILIKGIFAHYFISPSLLSFISGTIIVAYAFFLLLPETWEKVSNVLHLHQSTQLLQKSKQYSGIWGDIALGAALGPVFTTCSPTYLIILGTILPTSIGLGILYLAAYCLGLLSIVLLIGYGGRAVVTKLRFAANPHGTFKKIVALLLLLLGLSIITGFDKRFEQFILDTGYLGPISIEKSLQNFLAPELFIKLSMNS